VDCGCGFGKWGNILRVQKSQMRYSYIVGLDIFLPNLHFCREYGAYDDLILADARKLPFRNCDVDVVLASEIIEHMEKNEGQNFIAELERICKGRIVITTPNVHFDNPTKYFNETTNVYETHKSKWTTKDFKKRGYTVKGIGVKWILSRSNLLKNVVAAFDFLLFPGYLLPQMSKYMVAYKDKK
jgi:ubiquinone/menaquinone biosynthesis C-methylase UbiE